MRGDRRNYIVGGGFVLAMLAGLLAWIAVLSGRTGAMDPYYILYDNVTGLSEGTQVLYEGYPVGLIEEISRVEGAAGQRFRVDVSIRRRWRIPDDSIAGIIAPGLLSAFVIDIDAGSSRAILEPGSAIRSVESAQLFAAMSSVAERVPIVAEKLESVTDEFNRTLARVNELLSPGNTGRVERILANLETATAAFAGVSDDLRGTKTRLDDLLLTVNTMIEEHRDHLGDSIVDLRDSLEAVARHIDAISYNLEVTTRNMSEFSRQIRENPALIIRGRTPGSAPATAN